MVERNDVPVQQWLAIWELLQDTEPSLDLLRSAVVGLYLLWEPPSAREARRADDAVLEFREGDE